MSLRRIAACLDTKDWSHAPIQHARYLMELQRVFLEAAPSSLRTHASVGYWKNGALVLLTHNGAVAAKLQQTAPTLLLAYQKRGFEVTKIRFAVQVEAYAIPHFKRAKLSRKAAKAVGDLALELQNPGLKLALTKLASRVRD